MLEGTTSRPGGGPEVPGSNRKLSMSTWYDTLKDAVFDMTTFGQSSKRNKDYRVARQWNNYIENLFNDGEPGETARPDEV